MSIRLSDFKDVDAELTYAPAMVLFGPNDVGKTNVLEAFESVFGDDVFVRRDPSNPNDLYTHTALEATCEFDELEVAGSAERTFLHAGLSEGWFLPGDEWLDEFGVALKDPPEALEALVAAVGGWLMFQASEDCSDWARVADDYQVVLEACLDSRLFTLGWEHAWWLAPDPSTWRGKTRKACERLNTTRDLWQGGGVPLLQPLLTRERPKERYPFLGFPSPGLSDLPFFRDITAARILSAGETEDIANEIVAFVEEHTEEWLPVRSFGEDQDTEPSLVSRRYGEPEGTDFWLRREGDSERIDPVFVDACSKLGMTATKLAPPLVSARYDIVVRPLLASERNAFKGRKVRLALESRADEQVFDLSMVGSGVQTWAQYSLREAMRTLRRENTRDWERRARPVGKLRPARPQHPTLYVLDEPERHLHPSAQVEIASWLADRVRDGAQMLIATHALPFLDVPYEGTEYFRVFRDTKGLTRAARLTPDPIGRLDRVVREAGLASRAQLIQLTRAALMVEGEHDRLVIERFAGRELRAARVRVLSLGGARNASGIADLKLLQDLDVQLFLLFDNVSSRSISKLKEDRSDTLEVREIKLMLKSWPETRTRPHVLPFEAPDIICALPDEAVEQVTRQSGRSHGFAGWKPLVAEYRALHIRDRRDFKQFASVKTGLTFDIPTIRRILGRSPTTLSGDSPLYQPIQELLASVQ